MKKAKFVTVEVIEARNIPKLDLIGKVDPYCIVQIGKIKSKTRHINSTFNPQWKHTFKFKIEEKDLIDPDEINIEVSMYDRNIIFQDEFIGKIHKVMDLFPEEFEDWIEITSESHSIRKQLEQAAAQGQKCEIHLKVSKT